MSFSFHTISITFSQSQYLCITHSSKRHQSDLPLTPSLLPPTNSLYQLASHSTAKFTGGRISKKSRKGGDGSSYGWRAWTRPRTERVGLWSMVVIAIAWMCCVEANNMRTLWLLFYVVYVVSRCVLCCNSLWYDDCHHIVLWWCFMMCSSL